MAVTTLVTTVGAANANAYVTLAVAAQYHEDRAPQDSSWNDSDTTTDMKNRAILRATELMDDLFAWSGWVVDETQALLWPRNGMWYRSSYYVPSTTVPTEVQRACAEFAGQLLASDRSADYGVESKGVESMRVGPVAFTFKPEASPKVVPDAVANMIPPTWYTRIRGRPLGVRELVRA